MSIAKLTAELTGDPLGRGYSGFTDAEVAADINTAYRTTNKASMTGSEIVNQVDATEWAALTDAKKADFWDIVHIGTINPFGVEAALLTDVFGAGSDTIAALGVARKNDVSRAAELGIARVRVGHVQLARQ